MVPVLPTTLRGKRRRLPRRVAVQEVQSRANGHPSRRPAADGDGRRSTCPGCLGWAVCGGLTPVARRDAGGGAANLARRRPRPAPAVALFVCTLDAAAFEHALRRPQRRVGESRRAVRQPTGRRGRARLLHLERAEEGRAAAEAPADDRDGREGEEEEGGSLAAADQAGLRAPAARRRDLEADRPAGQGRPAGAGDDLSPRAQLSEHRRLRGLVRPHAHRARLLSGSLRASERRRAWADDGPLRPALAAARDLQQRLHLHGRQQRLDRQRPGKRAAGGRQRHPHRLSRRPRRDQEVERRPERGAERRVDPPEPAADHLERKGSARR